MSDTVNAALLVLIAIFQELALLSLFGTSPAILSTIYLVIAGGLLVLVAALLNRRMSATLLIILVVIICEAILLAGSGQPWVAMLLIFLGGMVVPMSQVFFLDSRVAICAVIVLVTMGVLPDLWHFRV